MHSPHSRARIVLRLPPGSIAPALARAGVASISSRLPEEVAADLGLLTSEVVGNAVRHAKTSPVDEITVRLAANGDRIRVEVVDPGPGFEPSSPSGPGDPRTHGWGLLLVNRLARSWGVEPEGSRNKVWFELDTAA